MSGSMYYLLNQVEKQILKKTILRASGLDDYSGIRPLNENEDIVVNEFYRQDSPARKDVLQWTEQDYYNAIHSYGFSQNYMLKNMCNTYQRLHHKEQKF